MFSKKKLATTKKAVPTIATAAAAATKKVVTKKTTTTKEPVIEMDAYADDEMHELENESYSDFENADGIFKIR